MEPTTRNMDPCRSLWRVLLLALPFVCASAPHAGQAPTPAAPELSFGFETGDLQGWRVVEGAFSRLLNDRKLFRNRRTVPFNKDGTYFLDTVEGGADRQTGVVESPVFVLLRPEVTFLIGGGRHANTYVALCTVDGKEVLKAHGKHDEILQPAKWRADAFVGQRVFVRIADGHTGGWGHVTFDNFRCFGIADPEATARHLRTRQPILPDLRKLTRPPPNKRPLPGTGNADSTRAAVEYLVGAYGDTYPEGAEILDRLSALVPQLEGEDPAQRTQAHKAFLQLQRAALIANPMVSNHPILFAVRHQYKPDHHNTATMFQAGTVNEGKFEGGGGLKTIAFSVGPDLRVQQTVRVLVEAGDTGVVRDPDVRPDGRSVAFAMRRNRKDGYHIYRIASSGGAPVSLTAAPGVTDIDPLWLADGGIAFTSTREPKYCMCNCHIMGNLFRMDADGANIHQIGKSTLHEGHGALMPDGRILYDRWEYVDRNFGDAQGLWTVNPDGTNHAVFWGNNTNSPGGVVDGRIIPRTHRAVCVFTSCHDRPWGALAIIDRRLATDGREPVVRTWPSDARDLVGKGNWDTFKKVFPRYEDPYPLTDPGLAGGPNAPVFLLCSRMTGNGEEMGIFLLDTFGNEILLHTESPGCYDPMPLAPRERPDVIPPRRDFRNDSGVLYVADVYQGSHMHGVKRGTVKYLRVVESPEKRFWTGPSWGGQGVHKPAMNWHSFENKRILGTVPVHDDGSASFEVPADRFVYFQLLDADRMMVQSMRSGTMVQAGEVTGCTGCHEARQEGPPLPQSASLEALAVPPAALTGWYGPAREFSFIDDVQPVLDRNCVGCHDIGKKAGTKLLLCGDRTNTFNIAYNELWRKGHIKAIGGGPAQIQPAYSWGSHASRLVQHVRAGHNDVQLSPEDLERVVTWIDINAPYYPTYASAYPNHLAGRSPLTGRQLGRLSTLVGVPLAKLAGHATNRGPQLSFDRPEMSPCLAPFQAAEQGTTHTEALAIINAGAAALSARPRGDSLIGFVACPVDRQRDAFYGERTQVELRVRDAISVGDRVYDPGVRR